MWKVLCAVAVLAAPIFCGPIEDVRKKTQYQRFKEEAWKEKCKNVSGVTVDALRNYRLNLKFENCKKAAVNNNELRQDFESIWSFLDFEIIEDFKFSNLQKNELVAKTRKHCPKADVFLGCNDIMDPIYNECYNTVELAGRKVEIDIKQRLANYFCGNESEAVNRFIDGKVTECAMQKKDELDMCYRMYRFSLLPIEYFVFFSLPNADRLCRSFDILGNCLAPILNQCELSPNAGTIAESLFTYIRETACVNHMEVKNRKQR